MTIILNGKQGLVPKLFPTGGIIAWSGTGVPAPPGWLLCDGLPYSQSFYKKLFNVIGSAYNTGGEPAGFFRLPNLQDKSILGSAVVFYGGAASHEHTFTTATTIANVASGDHSHDHGLGGGAMGGGTVGNHNHGSTLTSGSGNSASNISKGNGARQVQPANHSHSFGITGSNATNPGNHTHNSNMSNISGNGGNHETVHYPNVANAVAQKSYDSFGPNFNEGAAFNTALFMSVRGIIKA